MHPKIQITGIKRSGKSSIHQVVFHRVNAHETLYLETTLEPVETLVESLFSPVIVSDCPLNNVADIDADSLVYVVDAQDDYLEALFLLSKTIRLVLSQNSNIHLHVLIHKIDGLSDESRLEIQRDILQRINDDLQSDDIQVSFHLTSIYDHSIYEAFSKIIQKLIPQLPTLENLLDLLTSTSAIDKAFLFDFSSKLYIATDSAPVDMQSFELCMDMIDVLLDVSFIYSKTDEDVTLTNYHDEESHSLIKFSDKLYLYSRAITSTISLVCLFKSLDDFEKHLAILECNFVVFKNAIMEVRTIEE